MTVSVPGGWCLTPPDQAGGLNAFLLLYGGAPLQDYIGGVLAQVLAPQGVSAATIQAAINDIWQDNAPGWDQQVTEGGELFYALWAPNAVLLEYVSQALTAAMGALQRLDATSGPAALQSAVNTLNQTIQYVQQLDLAYTDQQTNALRYQLDAVYAALLQDIIATQQDFNAALTQNVQDLTNLLRSTAANLANYVNGTADGLAAAADAGDAALQAEINTIVADVNAALTALEGNITLTAQQGLAAANAIAAAQVAAAQAGQQTELQTVLTPVWAGTAESANQATATLVQIHPEETNNVASVATSIPVDVAAAVAATATMLRTVTQTLNDCALPQCQQLGKFGKDLSQIASMIELGALLALLVECARDPLGMARDAEAIIGTIGQDVVSSVRALI